MFVSAIIAGGGRGLRFGGDVPKQLRSLGGRSLLQRSVEAFLRSPTVHEVVVAVPAEVLAALPGYLESTGGRLRVIAGGQRRQDSVSNAFRAIDPRAELVVIHDAARPLVSQALIARTVEKAASHGAAIAALPATDTVKRGDADWRVVETLVRSEVFLAQTPQAFTVSVLREALSLASPSDEATDEAVLAERAGHRVWLVQGEPTNMKITTSDDLAMAERLIEVRPARMRVGTGYDLHRLVDGRPLILGGVAIPFARGLVGHSDADAVCHAVTDAVLGAAGLGDIGRLFPDSDEAWRGADSMVLLARAVAIVRRAGWRVVNVDVVVIAERPKVAPYAERMRTGVARALEIAPACVSIKGKTNEGVDATGTGDAIAVHAVALLETGAPPSDYPLGADREL